ncbi:MAG: hypothetical protein JWP22_3671, partial [Ramlibacter sp.]|nr:hypothetical protein [Ramlibacter sp.]
ISGTVAQVNAALSGLTFTPAANYNGGATLTLVTTDGTLTDTDTVAITVTPVNDAPVLDGSAVLALAGQNEDSGAPSGAVGTLVSALVGGISDVDSGALQGVAVTAAVTTNGSWFYSINGGASWQVLGAVSATSARLLAADAATRVYFQPNANFNGTIDPALTIRAWDQTSGSNGALANPSVNGGTTAFSTATDTVSLVINAVNDAPVGNTDSYSVVEGVAATRGNVLTNDTDVEASPLTVLQVASTSAGAPVPVNGTNAITTAMGGTVVMNSNGTFTYTAPARLHNDAVADIDSFVYKASDGALTSGWTTVNLTITDTGGTAVADVDSVGRNSSTGGNVITGTGGATADTLGADAALIYNVTYVGTPVSSSGAAGGSNWTINTGSGTLSIASDGSYTYTSSVSTPNTVVGPAATLPAWQSASVSSWGFDGTRPYTGGTLGAALVTSSLNATQAGFVRYRDNGGSTDDGIGVEATGGNSANNKVEANEDLILKLNNITSRAASVTVTDLLAGEMAIWYAYSATGMVVGNGSIAGSAGGIVIGSISTSSEFTYLSFSSALLSTFRINGIDAQPYVAPVVFDYSLSDADGGLNGLKSSATLTINTNTVVGAVADAAAVNEAGLLTGSMPNGVPTTASGNLLANDTGVTSTTSITAVNGTAPTAGVITLTDAFGTLQVWTTAGGGHVAGDYVYTLAAKTTEGASDSRVYGYTLTDSATTQTTTANLTVSVIDDVPLATSAIAEVPEIGAAAYRLVLMLDISASMSQNQYGGEVRAVQADGTASITTRLAMAKAGLVALVEEYFAQGSSVAVKLGVFGEAALMLNGGAAYTNLKTLTDAISAITGNEVANLGTAYDLGVGAMQAAWTSAANPFPTVPAGTAITKASYFLSDGAPSTGPAATTAIGTYTTYATANAISSYAVGMGTGIADVSYLNNLHTVDSDLNGVKDTAVIVPVLNQLNDTLVATVPSAYTGSVGGAGGASNVTFGADGGYISYIKVVLDTNNDGTPDTLVTFNYNKTTNSIDRNGVAFTTGDQLNLDASSGFTWGSLVFKFTTGEYTYFTKQSIVEGDTFDLSFQVTDGDGDLAAAVQTIVVVDGAPIARNDYDTLMPKTTFFEGNVVNGIGTDGGVSTSIADFASSAVSKDTILDNALITSVTFKGVVYSLTASSSGSAAGGTYTVNGGRLTWTSSTEAANQLIFDNDGYYKYTPPAAQTASPALGPLLTTNFTSAANAAANGVTLSGYSRTANLQLAPTYAHASLTYNDLTGTVNDGVGVPNGTATGGVDNLETLVITFDRVTHPRGVQNVTLDVADGSSNLAGATGLTYSFYDISGNLLGQIASSSEVPVNFPTTYGNIGSITIEAGSNSAARISYVSFYDMGGAGVAAGIAPETLRYTLTDQDGDTSSASLTLDVISAQYAGTAAANFITGTAVNDYISGQGGNDTLLGGAGYDVIRGDDGDDSIDGGADDDRLFGGNGNDTLFGNTGNDELHGGAGSDVLNGDAGDDTLYGEAGNDVLNGGAGSDVFYGGAGNDTLDAGIDIVSDVFKWELADTGSKGLPAVDTITNFNAAAASAGGDVLDLRDLLVGEHQSTGDLDHFLHFEKAGADTIIHVSSSGEFSAAYLPSREVQTIILQGVDLIGTMNTDQQIIADLLSKSKLVTD